MKAYGLVERKSSKGLSTGILKFFSLFVVFITVHNIFFGHFNISKTLELKRSLMEIESRKAQVEKENTKLEKLLNSIDRNPEYYREIFIREYMQLQKEEDKVILFYDS